MNTKTTPKIAARHLAANKINQGFKPMALHEYQDSAGQPLYWRIRLQHPQTKEKWIRPMYLNEQGRFSLGEPPFSVLKPLYRLAEITQHPDAIIWIVEGEWCVDHLIKIAIIATTSGSAKSAAAAADWSPLKNRKVIIWPDNDPVGLDYAEEVTKQVQNLDCSVQWVDIHSLHLPAKGDCVDWLSTCPGTNKAAIESLPLMDPILPIVQDDPSCIKIKSSKVASSFSIREQGVFYCDENEERWICSKLEVKALVRDKASENWGRLVEFFDADGNAHVWAMPMEMLRGSGEELRGELLRLGLEIAPGNKARNLLIEYITTSKPATHARCVTRTGWHHNTFVLPNRTIGHATEQVIYQSESQTRHYTQAGTLAEWQQAIATPCAGNSCLVLAVSCAFAALLLHPAGLESGGLHLVGESSCGKTTALRVAASVFGALDYLHRWRATTNGLEALATLHSDTLFILDELAQVDPKEAGEIAYMLANGSGKARAAKNGTARSRYEWRLLFLSAGEVGLAQHMREAGKRSKAGQEVRLVDIPANASKGFGLFDTLHDFASGAVLSKALVDAAGHYYGTAADAFLTTITQAEYFALLPGTLKTLSSYFITRNLPANTSGQVHRVCERFALIATAGELATDFGITGWNSGEAAQVAAVCFQAWLEQRGGAGNQEDAAFLAQVQAFFEAHGASRFEEIKSSLDHRILHRVGFKQSNGDGCEYFVLPEMFRREICQGFDPRWAAQLLIQMGMLRPSSEGKAQTTHRLPGEGTKKCYHFIRTEPV